MAYSAHTRKLISALMHKYTDTTPLEEKPSPLDLNREKTLSEKMSSPRKVFASLSEPTYSNRAATTDIQTPGPKENKTDSAGHAAGTSPARRARILEASKMKLDDALSKFARQEAAESGTNRSDVVAEYFAGLPANTSHSGVSAAWVEGPSVAPSAYEPIKPLPVAADEPTDAGRNKKLDMSSQRVWRVTGNNVQMEPSPSARSPLPPVSGLPPETPLRPRPPTTLKVTVSDAAVLQELNTALSGPRSPPHSPRRRTPAPKLSRDHSQPRFHQEPRPQPDSPPSPRFHRPKRVQYGETLVSSKPNLDAVLGTPTASSPARSHGGSTPRTTVTEGKPPSHAPLSEGGAYFNIRSNDISFQQDQDTPQITPVANPINRGRRSRDVYDREIRKFATHVYPRLIPSGRAEVALFAQWFENFRFQVEQRYEHTLDKTRYVNELSAVSSIAFQELTRQVGVHCWERAAVLIKVWNSVVRLLELEVPPEIDPEVHQDLIKTLQRRDDEIAKLKRQNIDRLKDLDRLRDASEKREEYHETRYDSLQKEVRFLQDLLNKVDGYANLVPQSSDLQWERLMQAKSDSRKKREALLGRASLKTANMTYTNELQYEGWSASIEILADYFTHLNPKDIPGSLVNNKKVKVGQDVATQTRRSRNMQMLEELADAQDEYDAEKIKFVDVSVQTENLFRIRAKDLLDQAKRRVLGKPDSDFDLPTKAGKKKKEKKQYQYVPLPIRSFLTGKARGLGRMKPPGMIARLISSMYQGRIEHVRREPKAVNDSFAAWVHAFFLKTYGIRDMAESHLIDFFKSIHAYLQTDEPTKPRMKLFLAFTNGEPPAGTLGDLNFYLRLYEMVHFVKRDGPQPVQQQESGVKWIDMQFCLDIVGKFFEFMGEHENASNLRAGVEAHDSKLKALARGSEGGEGSDGDLDDAEDEDDELNLLKEASSATVRLVQAFRQKILDVSKPCRGNMAKLWGAKPPERIVDFDMFMELVGSLWRYKKRDHEGELRSMFIAGDVDKDGLLNFEELQTLFRNDANISETKLLKMFREGSHASKADGISQRVFVRLATRYGFGAWRPEDDTSIERLQQRQTSDLDAQFVLLDETWEKEHKNIQKQLATLREKAIGVTAARRRTRKGTLTGLKGPNEAVLQASANEAPIAVDPEYVIRLENQIKRFLELKDLRQDPDAAWKAYRLLLAALKERPKISDAQLKQMIRNIPLFHDASNDFMSALLPRLKQSRFDNNEFLMYEGEIGREMYLIKDGKVEIIAGEDKRVIAVLSSGDFFGETALVRGVTRNASARTRGTCELCVLFKKDFDALIAKHPEMQEKIQAAANAKSLKREEILFNRRVVKKVPLFSRCSEGFIRQLVAAMKTQSVPQGHYLIRRGETGTEMFVLVEGEVAVMSGENDDQEVAVLRHGSVFGEVALIRNTERTASVIAKNPCTVCVLFKTDLDKLLGSAPEMRRVINAEAQKKMSDNISVRSTRASRGKSQRRR